MYLQRGYEEKYKTKRIDCYFAICTSCYWTATIFTGKENKLDGRIQHIICPLCKKDGINTIGVDNSAINEVYHYRRHLHNKR